MPPKSLTRWRPIRSIWCWLHSASLNSSSLRGLPAVPAFTTRPPVSSSWPRAFASVSTKLDPPGRRRRLPRRDGRDALQQSGSQSPGPPPAATWDTGELSALQTRALRYAIAGHYDYVLTVDGDGRHPPGTGARLVLDNSFRRISMCASARVSSRPGTMPARLEPASRDDHVFLAGPAGHGSTVLRHDVGAQAMRRTVLEPLTAMELRRFPWSEAIVYLMRLGWRVGEYPVIDGGQAPRAIHVYAGRPRHYPLRTPDDGDHRLARASLTRRTRHP